LVLLYWLNAHGFLLMFQLRFSLLIILAGSLRGVAVFSPSFGASVCIYKEFCDSTFRVWGEKSESENFLLPLGLPFFHL
jgi:hypothetical protein